MQRIYWKHQSETSFLRLTVADLQPVSLQTYELFKILFLNLFYVYDFLLAYMYVHHTYLQKSEEGIRFFGSGVADGYKPPCGF